MNQRNFSGKNVERKSRANSYGFNGLNAGNIDEDDCMLGKLLLIHVNTNSNLGIKNNKRIQKTNFAKLNSCR